MHKTRLLNVEERPFKRITKRLLKPNSFLSTPSTRLPTPPLDANGADEEAAAVAIQREKDKAERRQWREDALVDFAAFEASIVRIQFLRNSNEKERERYSAEKVKIIETAQAVRDNTAELRVQLEEAQKTLALRKTWDELAQKITNNRMLKPREDQHVQQEKLGAEIADLEQEGKDIAQTWTERKEQYGRIMEECRPMLRMIRNEPEETDAKENIEEAEGDDQEHRRGRLGGGVMSGTGSGVETPRPDAGDATPLHTSKDYDSFTPSKPSSQRDRLQVTVASPSRSHTRTTSPGDFEATRIAAEDTIDTEMAEPEQASSTAQIARPDDNEPEEGEEQENDAASTPFGDKMDVT